MLTPEGVLLPPEVSKVPTEPREAVIFTHLFPNNRFDRLFPLNPVALPLLLKRIIWDADTRGKRFLEAAKNGQGFAERVDLPYLDKATMAYEAQWLTPSPEKIPYGLVSDLLQVGERLGGVCLKEINLWNDKTTQNLESLGRAVLDKNANLQDSSNGKVIGVVGKDARPRAYILFREGKRRRGRKRSTALTARVTAKPVIEVFAPAQ